MSPVPLSLPCAEDVGKSQGKSWQNGQDRGRKTTTVRSKKYHSGVNERRDDTDNPITESRSQNCRHHRFPSEIAYCGAIGGAQTLL